MTRDLAFAMALAGVASGVAAETGTPVTLERRESPEVAQELRIYGDFGGDMPHATAVEWRRRVEVRTRAVSGEALSDEDRQDVRDLALHCGELGGATPLPQNEMEWVEADNTFVLSFDCFRME